MCLFAKFGNTREGTQGERKALVTKKWGDPVPQVCFEVRLCVVCGWKCSVNFKALGMGGELP